METLIRLMCLKVALKIHFASVKHAQTQGAQSPVGMSKTRFSNITVFYFFIMSYYMKGPLHVSIASYILRKFHNQNNYKHKKKGLHQKFNKIVSFRPKIIHF